MFKPAAELKQTCPRKGGREIWPRKPKKEEMAYYPDNFATDPPKYLLRWELKYIWNVVIAIIIVSWSNNYYVSNTRLGIYVHFLYCFSYLPTRFYYYLHFIGEETEIE